MKKNLLFLLLAFIAVSFTACNDDEGTDDSGKDKKAPVITWAENPDFDTLAIKKNMSAVIAIEAEAGVKSLQLDINSPALTDMILGAVGLGTSVDLAKVDLSDYAAVLSGIPYGSQVVNATSLTFDVSSLVPMIIALPNNEGDHVFDINVTDNNDKSTKCKLVFNYKKVAVDFQDVDLWKNTATVVAMNTTETMNLQYRRKGTEEWQDAVRNDDGTFAIATEWTQSKNEAGLDIQTPNTNKGIWAGITYEYQIVEGQDVAITGEYTAEKGDVIPNGDMASWITKDGDLPYPNLEDGAFWDSGNNSMSKTLCTKDEDSKNPYAKLAAKNVYGIMMASGNLFTGNFKMETITGTASFGAKYTYTARPTALKVRCHVTVGAVDAPKQNAPKIAVGLQDTARIMVCITDWQAQHGVVSGLGTPTGMWDPVSKSGLTAEEKIVAYGSLEFGKSTEGDQLVEVLIPLHYYDKDAVIPTSAFNLVIACSTSKYGDYGNGCSTNVMKVDDFEWVY